MMTALHLATPSFSPDTTISSLATLAGGTLMRAPVSSISCLMFWLYGPHTKGWNAFGTGSLSNASFAWKRVYHVITILCLISQKAVSDASPWHQNISYSCMLPISINKQTNKKKTHTHKRDNRSWSYQPALTKREDNENCKVVIFTPLLNP